MKTLVKGPETVSPAPLEPLGMARELEAVGMFVKRDYLHLTHFLSSFVTSIFAAVGPLFIYGMIARFGEEVPALQNLAGGYINFLISGMMIHLLLTTAVSGPYDGVMESFSNDRLEIILASPLRLPVFVTGLAAGRYVKTVIQVVIYLAGGLLVLGFHFTGMPAFHWLLAVLIPAILACTGLGLMAASSIYTLDARGGQDPVRFFVGMISGLLAGVYFPLQLLPVWAQWIGHLVPHTYAIDGVRRAVFGVDSVPLLPIHGWVPASPLTVDCSVLVLYALVALPIGWKTFQFGIRLARTDGRLSRWQ